MRYVLGISLLLTAAVAGPSGVAVADGRRHADRPQQSDDPKTVDATAGILAAFDRYPLVAIAESHGHQELYYFLERLVAEPEFSKKVNDIVVECGNALHQATVDRYIAGEDVPLAEVQKAWRTSTQTLSSVFDTPMYGRLFVKVREVNKTLPAERRLRILLGDPPIDWDRITTREQAIEILKDRDPHYERVVIDEVLKKGRRALLIAGALHFYRVPREVWALPQFHPGVGSLLERDHPGKLLVVRPVSGPLPRTEDPDGRLAQRLEAYRPGAWMADLKGTWIGRMERRRPPFPSIPETTLEDRADALLYLGPSYTEATVSMFFYAVERDYFLYKNRIRKLILGKGFEEEVEPGAPGES